MRRGHRGCFLDVCGNKATVIGHNSFMYGGDVMTLCTAFDGMTEKTSWIQKTSVWSYLYHLILCRKTSVGMALPYLCLDCAFFNVYFEIDHLITHLLFVSLHCGCLGRLCLPDVVIPDVHISLFSSQWCIDRIYWLKDLIIKWLCTGLCFSTLKTNVIKVLFNGGPKVY
jgi:hypothetical protein